MSCNARFRRYTALYYRGIEIQRECCALLATLATVFNAVKYPATFHKSAAAVTKLQILISRYRLPGHGSKCSGRTSSLAEFDVTWH